jgi:hypothetical protein
MRRQLVSFTPEAMGALGKGISEHVARCEATSRRCNRFAQDVRNRSAAALGRLHEDRRRRAERAADARRVYASELRSGVRALLDRCELTRASLATEINAAREAFRSTRPRHSGA